MFTYSVSHITHLSNANARKPAIQIETFYKDQLQNSKEIGICRVTKV